MQRILSQLPKGNVYLPTIPTTMAPSSDQASTTPNMTDPDLQPMMASPHSPSHTPTLNTPSPTPQSYQQEMEMLEQL